MTTRWLVAVDGSPSSLRALDVATRLAAGTDDARLDVVAVLDLAAHDVYSGFHLTEAQLAQIERSLDDEALAPARARLAAARVPGTVRVLRGHAADAIVQEASAQDVAMVFVGKTGKGPLQKLLQGSVSRSVTNLSPAPVTVVA